MVESRTIRKGFMALTLGVIMSLGLALNVFAQVGDPLAGQPAMTEAEVKTYLEAFKKMAAAGADQAKIMDAMDNSGMDQMRFVYVTTKFNSALLIIENGEAAKANIPPSAMPTDDEIAIVKDYVGDYKKIVAENGE